jgi:hypothetical protein
MWMNLPELPQNMGYVVFLRSTFTTEVKLLIRLLGRFQRRRLSDVSTQWYVNRISPFLDNGVSLIYFESTRHALCCSFNTIQKKESS